MTSGKSRQNVPPSRRRLFKILTVTLSLLICFVCLELSLRAWGPRYYPINSSSHYISNPRGYFDVRRVDGDQIVYGVDIQFARTDDRPRRRVPDGPLTQEELQAYLLRKDAVLGLGDSFTVGQGVRYEDTYLRRLELLLAEDSYPVTIVNTGVQGYDLDEISQVYDTYAAHQHYPLVIYGFVLNDFGLPGIATMTGWDYITINNQQTNPLRLHSAVVNFIFHSIETIQLDRVTRKAYLDSFSGSVAQERFALLRSLARRIRMNDSQLVIVLFPLLYNLDDYEFQEIHDKFDRFCRQAQIPLLDLLPAFAEQSAEALWVHPTDHHPNEIAHRIAAEEIHEFLRRQGLLERIAVEESPHGESHGGVDSQP